MELDLGFGGAQTRLGGDRVATFRPSLAAAFDPLVLKSRVRPVGVLGVGVELETTRGEVLGGRDRRLAVQPELGGGLVVSVLGALQFRTDVRLVVDLGPHDAPPYAHATLTAGIETRLSMTRDRDNDFVPDRDDACPTTPEELDGFEDEDGCPDNDNDGDGVRDALDACDDVQEDLDGVDDEDGCPEPS